MVVEAFTIVADVADKTLKAAEVEYRFVEVELDDEAFVVTKLVVVAFVAVRLVKIAVTALRRVEKRFVAVNPVEEALPRVVCPVTLSVPPTCVFPETVSAVAEAVARTV